MPDQIIINFVDEIKLDENKLNEKPNWWKKIEEEKLMKKINEKIDEKNLNENK